MGSRYTEVTLRMVGGHRKALWGEDVHGEHFCGVVQTVVHDRWVSSKRLPVGGQGGSGQKGELEGRSEELNILKEGLRSQ